MILPFLLFSCLTFACLVISQCCIYFRATQSKNLHIPIWNLNIKDTKNMALQSCCHFVWVSNLVSYMKGTTKAEGVQEQAVEADVLD